MTTATLTLLTLHVGRGRAWRDLFVVAFLLLILGTFLAAVLSPPRFVHLEPIGSAPGAIISYG